MAKREFSDNEVLTARIFCLVVGAIMTVGGSIAFLRASEGAAIAGGIAAVLGVVLALFGALSSREKCVGAAGWILEILS